MFAEIVTQDVTVLLTEQNVPFAFDLAERAYIIEKGTNVYEGPIEDLRSREDLLDKHLSVAASEAD